MSWQLQEAKQRFSEVVRRAIEEGPQVVTRHGREAAIVISVQDLEKLKGERVDFKELLRTAPDLSRLKISRDRRPGRRVRL